MMERAMKNEKITGIQELQKDFKGEIVLPADAGYDAARAIWNGMIGKRPAAIARAADRSDVVRAVNFARDRHVPLAIRGGGHNIAGSALVDGGLVIDMTRMKAVSVDKTARRATVEAGSTLADVDAATQAHGLAVPVGINSTTGIGGLTLGGGLGWLSRKYGMTVDNLESAEVVTAAGAVGRARGTGQPDPFSAVRGGGGNFGVVTRFEFRAHPVGPQVLAGLVVYPHAQAQSVMRQYRDYTAQTPEDLTVWTVLRKAPPLPFLPAEAHGTDVVVLAGCYAGDPAEGEQYFAPLHKFGTPLGAHIGVQPFAAWQQAFDPLPGAGARNYWKSHYFSAFPNGLINAVVELSPKALPHSEIFIGQLGGATTRPAVDA